MGVSIPGNPGHLGMTLNVPYCSDVTITIVELSAANYFNYTCTADRLVLMQSLRRAAGSLQNRLAHFALCRLTVLFSLMTFPYAFLFDLHIFGHSQFLHKLVPTENLLSIHTFTVAVTGHWAVGLTDR